MLSFTRQSFHMISLKLLNKKRKTQSSQPEPDLQKFQKERLKTFTRFYGF